MAAKTLILAALLVATTVLAAAPAVEARQACTYGTGDPCDTYLVCVWDRVHREWICEGYIDPCWFRCW